MNLADQQKLIQRAIEHIDAGRAGDSLITRGARRTLAYVQADHAEDGCPATPGDCHGVELARYILREGS